MIELKWLWMETLDADALVCKRLTEVGRGGKKSAGARVETGEGEYKRKGRCNGIS